MNKSYTKILAASAGLLFGVPANSAVYKEVNGVVCVEAEHFNKRQKASDDDHAWFIAPDEEASREYLNARGGKYMVVFPDSGQNRNNADALAVGPYMEYEVEISTIGEYRLWLRVIGYDGASDSLYATIQQLRSDNGGSGPNWYRKAPTPTSGDFATLNGDVGWDGDGGLDAVNGNAGGDPMLFNITQKGTYTVRIMQREDGLGVDAFVLQLSSKAAPAQDIPESPTEGTFILVNKQPTNVSVGTGGTANFSVDATGSAAVTYQWQRAAKGSSAFSDVGGATSASYTTAALTPADDGAQYRVKLTIPGKEVLSKEVVVNVDTTPPTVAKVTGSGGFTLATIRFSEPVDKTTAETAGNYTLEGLTISSATLGADRKTVTLATSKQDAGKDYKLTIRNIKDVVSPANTIAPNPTTSTLRSFAQTLGAVGFEAYVDETPAGTPIDGLLNNANFPDKPDLIATATSMNSRDVYPNDSHENYGGRMRAYLVPKETGNYHFFLRSDDSSRLFISSNETFPDPNSATPDAEETGCCDAFKEPGDGVAETTAAPISLQAGKRYAILVLWKEGGGGDYAQVAWRKEGDNTPAASLTPISGQFLSWFADPDAKLDITQDPANTTGTAGGAVTFSVRYAAESFMGSSAQVQWQKAAKGSTTFSDIAGATGLDYNINFADPADDGAKFRAVVSVGTLVTKTSKEVTLTLSKDSIPPTLESIAGSAQAVNLRFSEPLDGASAATAANYSINGGASITGAKVISAAGAPGVVQLSLGGATAGKTYAVTVSNKVKDRADNGVVGNPTGSFVALTAFYDFNAGLPTGAALTGPATLLPNRGPDGSGSLMLTTSATSLQGTFITGDISGGKDVGDFTANFKVWVGQGSGNPADGYAFVLSGEVSEGTNFGEEGTGNQLIIAFDTYDNGAGEAPAIDVKWGGQEIATKKVSKATLVNNKWVDVSIKVAGGKVTVSHDGVVHHNALTIDGYAPIAGARIAIGARTGGEFETHLIDDLAFLNGAGAITPDCNCAAPAVRCGSSLSCICCSPSATPGGISGVRKQGNDIVIEYTGTLESSDNVAGPYTAVAGAKSGTPIGASKSAQFYRAK